MKKEKCEKCGTEKVKAYFISYLSDNPDSIEHTENEAIICPKCFEPENKSTNEEWENELLNMGTQIFQGQLPHAIYGYLFDPNKLKDFIRQKLSQAEEKGYQRGAKEALESVRLEYEEIPVNYCDGKIPTSREILEEGIKMGEINGHRKAVSEFQEKANKFLDKIK